jgi:hypothetical protein
MGGSRVMHSRLTKPKVSEVKVWSLMSDVGSPFAKVYYADIDDAFLKVKPKLKGYRVKYFYGENAWADARRYAKDIYTAYMHGPQKPNDILGNYID